MRACTVFFIFFCERVYSERENVSLCEGVRASTYVRVGTLIRARGGGRGGRRMHSCAEGLTGVGQHVQSWVPGQ